MMPLFTADDFKVCAWESFTKERAAKLANDKLDEWLKDAKVVYGDTTKADGEITCWSTEHEPEYNTHRALLINIEELPKPECKHEPDIVEPGVYPVRCIHCNVKLKATSWAVAE